MQVTNYTKKTNNFNSKKKFSNNRNVMTYLLDEIESKTVSSGYNL